MKGRKHLNQKLDILSNNLKKKRIINLDVSEEEDAIEMEFQETEALDLAIKAIPLMDLKSEELTSAKGPPVARD